MLTISAIGWLCMCGFHGYTDIEHYRNFPDLFESRPGAGVISQSGRTAYS